MHNIEQSKERMTTPLVENSGADGDAAQPEQLELVGVSNSEEELATSYYPSAELFKVEVSENHEDWVKEMEARFGADDCVQGDQYTDDDENEIKRTKIHLPRNKNRYLAAVALPKPEPKIEKLPTTKGEVSANLTSSWDDEEKVSLSATYFDVQGAPHLLDLDFVKLPTHWKLNSELVVKKTSDSWEAYKTQPIPFELAGFKEEKLLDNGVNKAQLETNLVKAITKNNNALTSFHINLKEIIGGLLKTSDTKVGGKQTCQHIFNDLNGNPWQLDLTLTCENITDNKITWQCCASIAGEKIDLIKIETKANGKWISPRGLKAESVEINLRHWKAYIKEMQKLLLAKIQQMDIEDSVKLLELKNEQINRKLELKTPLGEICELQLSYQKDFDTSAKDNTSDPKWLLLVFFDKQFFSKYLTNPRKIAFLSKKAREEAPKEEITLKLSALGGKFSDLTLDVTDVTLFYDSTASNDLILDGNPELKFGFYEVGDDYSLLQKYVADYSDKREDGNREDTSEWKSLFTYEVGNINREAWIRSQLQAAETAPPDLTNQKETSPQAEAAAAENIEAEASSIVETARLIETVENVDVVEVAKELALVENVTTEEKAAEKAAIKAEYYLPRALDKHSPFKEHTDIVLSPFKKLRPVPFEHESGRVEIVKRLRIEAQNPRNKKVLQSKKEVIYNRTEDYRAFLQADYQEGFKPTEDASPLIKEDAPPTKEKMAEEDLDAVIKQENNKGIELISAKPPSTDRYVKAKTYYDDEKGVFLTGKDLAEMEAENAERRHQAEERERIAKGLRAAKPDYSELSHPTVNRGLVESNINELVELMKRPSALTASQIALVAYLVEELNLKDLIEKDTGRSLSVNLAKLNLKEAINLLHRLNQINGLAEKIARNLLGEPPVIPVPQQGQAAQPKVIKIEKVKKAEAKKEVETETKVETTKEAKKEPEPQTGTKPKLRWIKLKGSKKAAEKRAERQKVEAAIKEMDDGNNIYHYPAGSSVTSASVFGFNTNSNFYEEFIHNTEKPLELYLPGPNDLGLVNGFCESSLAVADELYFTKRIILGKEVNFIVEKHSLRKSKVKYKVMGQRCDKESDKDGLGYIPMAELEKQWRDEAIVTYTFDVLGLKFKKIHQIELPLNREVQVRELTEEEALSPQLQLYFDTYKCSVLDVLVLDASKSGLLGEIRESVVLRKSQLVCYGIKHKLVYYKYSSPNDVAKPQEQDTDPKAVQVELTEKADATEQDIKPQDEPDTEKQEEKKEKKPKGKLSFFK